MGSVPCEQPRQGTRQSRLMAGRIRTGEHEKDKRLAGGRRKEYRAAASQCTVQQHGPELSWHSVWNCRASCTGLGDSSLPIPLDLPLLPAPPCCCCFSAACCPPSAPPTTRGFLLRLSSTPSMFPCRRAVQMSHKVSTCLVG